MFWIRYRDASNNLVETSLSPGPMDVDYPEGDGSTSRNTQDGAIVVQRSLYDGRPRKWLWNGYGPNHANYATLWTFLESLKSRARLDAGLSATVDVWEDTTGAGGFDRRDGSGNKVYTTVRVTQVYRTPLKGGGPVYYNSVFEFCVDDANYVA